MVFKLDANTRAEMKKKSERKDLRRNGFIPAVIYSEGNDALSITIERNTFMKAYKQSFNEVAFFELTVDGTMYRTIIRQRQMHPVTREIQHIDFLQLVDDRKVEIGIPVTFINEPAGVKLGARLEIAVRRLNVKILAKDIPAKVEIDMKNMTIGHSILVRDISLPNAEILSPENLALVSLNSPRGMSRDEVEELDA